MSQTNAESLPVAHSLLLGLGGLVIFAILSCIAVGILVGFLEATDDRNEIGQAIIGIFLFLVASGTYVCTLLALHVIASSEMPLAVRLALTFAMLMVCLRLATWPLRELDVLTYAFLSLPLCFGGFLLRWRKGWRALAADQSPSGSRMTIARLLDATASIALVLGLLTAMREYDSWGLVCFLPGSFIQAMMGMHVWARLCALCPVIESADSANASWVGINVLLALIVFVSVVVVFSTSPGAFVAFVVAPSFLLVTYLWTEIPLRWLRGRGWQFVRTGD